MKKVFQIPKNRLYSVIDYTKILTEQHYAGIGLRYNELDCIALPEGDLCAFDAYTAILTYKPFTALYPDKGAPFYLEAATSQGARIAFAGIRFSEKPATVWKLAMTDARDVLRLRSDMELVAVSVPSGVVCFASYSAMRGYAHKVKNESIHPLDIYMGADYIGAVPQKGQLAAFTTGWGEGSYRCYNGMDEQGQICAFICDFGMFDMPKKTDNSFESVEVDIGLEEIYRDDPNKTDAENHVQRWTTVLQLAEPDDIGARFNAYIRRGFAYHSQKKLFEALEDYKKAIEFGRTMRENPGFKFHAWSLFDNAGQIMKQLGNYDDAAALFNEALAYGDTFYAGAYTHLIEIYLTLKNLDKALEISQRMLNDRPQDPNAYLKNAEICVSMQDFETAASRYDVLIKTFKLVEYIFEKAACYIEVGRLEDAAECLEEYLVENKPNEQYYYNTALIKFHKKQLVDAYGDLLKSFDINPEYIPTLHLLIELDELFNNRQNLVRWATDYIELRGQSEYGYNIRALSCAAMGNYAAAVSDILYIIEHFNNDGHYYAYLCFYYALSKDYSKAYKILKRLKRQNSEYYNYALMIITLTKHRRKLEKIPRFLMETQIDDSFLILVTDIFIKIGELICAEGMIRKLNARGVKSPEFTLLSISFARAQGDLVRANSLIEEYAANFLGCGVSGEAIKNL